MNAVVIAVIVMLILSLLRVNVVLALIVGALAGGLTGGLGLGQTVSVFTEGLGGNATVAVSYALLGAFAVALTKTGLPDAMVEAAVKLIGKEGDTRRKTLSKALIVFVILIISCMSQNVVPVHIAFIPVLIPPLLKILNELQVDRRLIACAMTFGLTAPYILLPVGFGQIFQGILKDNMKDAGLSVTLADIPIAMIIPIVGMIAGLAVAAFVYRKPRTYEMKEIAGQKSASYTKKSLSIAVLAIAVSLSVQLYLSQSLDVDGMIFGALSGLAVLFLSGAMKRGEADELITNGMNMMAFIGFVMLAAAGFANVLEKTGDVKALVEASTGFISNNQVLGALLMLVVGLLITMGIGSSFATIPIIATIFVPLCMQLGFSPMATIAIIGTAAALGDAGSPASDSTLGPTSGLNADGQHHHIWDTCVPTFIFYNIPLILFGWIAAIVL
ncbi:Na+/H+ antiporter family protein [Bacillus sp. FSL W8-0445]|jgi:predicted histidine transporter YuiF (NhaC family)|uniref:Na+/H+ antiporter YuiF n=4 Tax=Bacillus licheniformis TaxID=1402 RepID=Q65FE7_BACLD|nr:MULTISPECIES: Na+/H+ antiporter family protein [Bacillus]MDP4079850.1 Na+/H+ antiporter family protein [Bacillota bacterium]AAU24848.1 Na+/H+ antiporter YuiF [Bacillus licheniformis DSM 13 = ATCC 14580]AAU42217.1 putative Na+/H+ antiporter YuiF [Bacillus licheniformis DSM 13 = ATCC 14580]AMR11825.1 sodium:proton antiporter [Bacillus licheniformis]AOP16588.1 Putative amino acid transporter YuiF [Bacillus licheniformis]